MAAAAADVGQELGADLLGVHGGRVVLHLVRQRCAQRARTARLRQCERRQFAEWARLLGDDSAAIRFLRYLPERLSPLGVRVETALRERLAEVASFVAFEGYDTVAVLADMPRSHGSDRARICRILAARCSRRHPRADPVLSHARHQRLAMGLDANPSRGSGSGKTPPLPSPPRHLRQHGICDSPDLQLRNMRAGKASGRCSEGHFRRSQRLPCGSISTVIRLSP
jgi:hypothetical protein